MKQKPMAALLPVLLSVLVVSASAVGGGTGSSSRTVVTVAFNKTLKKSIVVDGKGRTVYMFTDDTGGKPTCTVRLDPSCPKIWPPVKSQGRPLAGNGIIASKLGIAKRPDGSTQVTYNRHPLYYYLNDTKPGDVRGQAFYQLWYVLSPKGTPIRR